MATEGPEDTREDSHSRKKIGLAIVDANLFFREVVVVVFGKLCPNWEIASFESSDQCLASEGRYDLILFYVHGRLDCDSIRTLLALAPVVVLSSNESQEVICMAIKIGVRGYIPTTSTTPELTVEIINLVKCGGTFIPPSSLQLNGNNFKRQDDPANMFTEKEKSVLQLLNLGKPNKIIAFELNVSESSVKFHVRNIIAKLKVSNRTAVAHRLRELDIKFDNGLNQPNQQPNKEYLCLFFLALITPVFSYL